MLSLNLSAVVILLLLLLCCAIIFVINCLFHSGIGLRVCVPLPLSLSFSHIDLVFVLGFLLPNFMVCFVYFSSFIIVYSFPLWLCISLLLPKKIKHIDSFVVAVFTTAQLRLYSMCTSTLFPFSF